jgi:hypothetical protein
MSMRNAGPLAAAAAALGLLLAACSSGAYGAGPAASPARHHSTASQVPPAAAVSFGWFRPGAAPGGWRHLGLPGQRAVLSYAPSLHAMKGDKGTVTAGLPGPPGITLVYLNATPRQGDETTGGWPGFRVDHLRDEHQHAIHIDATSAMLPFRGGGQGRCLIDHYTTTTNVIYREIACYVRDGHAASVLVAATPLNRWGTYAGLLERTVSSYQAG